MVLMAGSPQTMDFNPTLVGISIDIQGGPQHIAPCELLYINTHFKVARFKFDIIGRPIVKYSYKHMEANIF